MFRHIGLDERDHMNMSFTFCDKPEWLEEYDGMPESAIESRCIDFVLSPEDIAQKTLRISHAESWQCLHLLIMKKLKIVNQRVT